MVRLKTRVHLRVVEVWFKARSIHLNDQSEASCSLVASDSLIYNAQLYLVSKERGITEIDIKSPEYALEKPNLKVPKVSSEDDPKIEYPIWPHDCFLGTLRGSEP